MEKHTSVKKHQKPSASQGSLIFALTSLFLVGIAYMNALSVPFILDDVGAIRENPNIGDPSMIFAAPLSFLRALLIYIPYMIGGLDPLLYHVLNIGFHFGTVFFLFLVIRELFNARYAWITAILFAVHPILTESVTWISSLPTPQYSCFLMASLYCYIKQNKTHNLNWYYGSIGLFILSILSAEKAVILPILLLLTEFSFFSIKKNWKKTIPYFIGSAVFGGLMMMNIGSRTESFAQNFYTKKEFYNPLVQLPYSISHYLQLIFFPKDLTIYHADIAIPWAELGIRWAVLLILLAVIYFSYKKSRPVFYWLCFFLIALAPTLIPLNIVWMVAERYAYLATAGVIAAVAYPLSRLAEDKRKQTIVFVVVGFVAVSLLARTIIRNNNWQSEDDLWIATIKASPYSPSAHNNMGDYYARHNDPDNAVREFSNAVKLKPDYGDAYHNLALAYASKKDYANAEKNYLIALKYNPHLWQSLTNLAVIYVLTKDYPKAQMYMEEALKYGPPNARLSETLDKIKRGELK